MQSTTTLVYYYDDLVKSTVTSLSLISPAVTTYIFDVLTAATSGSVIFDKYLSVSSGISGTVNYADVLDTETTWTQCAQLDLYIGGVYVLDYTRIASSVTGKGFVDTLLLSRTLDGHHWYGTEYSEASFISYNSTGGVGQIILDLRPGNDLFPKRIYYYLQAHAGYGGNGCFNIKERSNTGAINVVGRALNYYQPFLSGQVLESYDTDDYADPGYTLVYSPFHGLNSSGNVSLLNQASSQSTATYSLANRFVNLDNNRFLVLDVGSGAIVTIALSYTNTGPTSIASDVATKFNQAFSISQAALQCQVTYDSSSNKFTFFFLNQRQYRFIFQGADSNGIDLYNSAAELLGFSQFDVLTDLTNSSSGSRNTTSASITSTVPLNLTINSRHFFQVATSAYLFGKDTVRWSEIISSSSGFIFMAGLANMMSGSRFMQDLSVGTQVLLGEELDVVFTITDITSDTQAVLNSAAVFTAAQQDPMTGINTYPSMSLTCNLYVYNNMNNNKFVNTDSLVLFSTSNIAATNDYDGQLINQDISINRVSPIRLTIGPTNTLLNLEGSDTENMSEFMSIKNHNMYYIKNNSRYHFTTSTPATATVAYPGKGGNPVSIGAGIKFALLFSNTDTPGDMLGFPNCGTAAGDTAYATILSNTVADADSTFAVVRTEPGTGAQAGTTKVVTATVHTFNSGDTVYIQNCQGSSNDLAVNSNYGWVISTNSALTEIHDGTTVVRGCFYIPLALTGGGTGGTCFETVLYKPFTLQGDNYCYLTCPQLSSVGSSSSVIVDVFAKLLLNSPPGAIIFNSFASSDAVFEESPLAQLEYLDFAFVDSQNQLFDFNNIDHSFSLLITSYIDIAQGTGHSSRRGKQDLSSLS